MAAASRLNSVRVASTSASVQASGASTPVPGTTSSGTAPARTPITGRPLAMASSTTRPKVSQAPAWTSASQAARWLASRAGDMNPSMPVMLPLRPRGIPGPISNR